MLAEALVCAAILMNAPVPDGIVSVEVSRDFVEKVCGEDCVAFFHPSGLIVTSVPEQFDAWVHEVCHAVQFERPGFEYGPRAELECGRVQQRSGECRR